VTRHLAAVGLFGAVTTVALPVRAQPLLPSAPIALAGGRLVLAGEIAASIGPNDHPGYFNYTDYTRTPLRMLRLDLTAAWTPRARLAVLGQLRTENLDRPQIYAAYLRVRPWPDRAVDVQVGRIPPVFGAFARRAYATTQPLVSYPLAYQYLTTLRPDALPATADQVLRQRGRGWRVSYPIGDPTPAGGVPLVSAFRWDTGLQVHLGTRPVAVAVALTLGTLSDPRVAENNDGRQLSARLALEPTPGLRLGVSAARGAFAARRALEALPPHARAASMQRAIGADAEYSRAHWLVASELVVSQWTLPAVDAPAIRRPLTAVGAWVEGRYRVSPRVYLAGRADHLGFSRLAGTLFDGRPTSWDAPVSRASAAVGVYLRRNLVGRVEYQYNWRDGGRPRERGLASTQILYWF
jgi:hypothetical protein